MNRTLRILVLLLIAIIITILSLSEAGKAQETEKKLTPSEIAVQKKLEEEKQKERERKREMVRDAKRQLNGTSWSITLKESTTKKDKEIIEDTLTFDGGKIGSGELISLGFNSSNFTVRIKREDRVIWETMQNSEEEGLAFWRGELKKDEDGVLGDVMRGVLSRHLNDKKKTVIDYTFVSESMGDIEEEEVEPEVTEEEVVAEDAIGEVKPDEIETEKKVN